MEYLKLNLGENYVGLSTKHNLKCLEEGLKFLKNLLRLELILLCTNLADNGYGLKFLENSLK